MRSILTLSLPPDVLGSLKKKAKKAGLTVSAYIRCLLIHEEHLISEEELVQYAKEAEGDLKNGRATPLRDLNDLLKDRL